MVDLFLQCCIAIIIIIIYFSSPFTKLMRVNSWRHNSSDDGFSLCIIEVCRFSFPAFLRVSFFDYFLGGSFKVIQLKSGFGDDMYSSFESIVLLLLLEYVDAISLLMISVQGLR